MAVLMIEHIEQTPDVCHGAPRIAGTRIRVQDIVAWHIRGGWSIEEIVNEFKLMPAQIYAALAFYYDHQLEIDRALADDEPVPPGQDFKDLQARIAQRK